MKKSVIYVHGLGGNAEEADRYAPLFRGCDVIGFDYAAKNPWEATAEFPPFFDEVAAAHDSVSLIANSIGAYYTMCALGGKKIDAAYFISPIVDMEKLILDMMARAGVSEAELKSKSEITTPTGDVLSWDYLSYVRNNPPAWSAPTHIVCGSRDSFTTFETMSGFAEAHGATLTVLDGGEHWFHTDEQMKFIDDWLIKTVGKNGQNA